MCCGLSGFTYQECKDNNLLYVAGDSSYIKNTKTNKIIGYIKQE